MNTLAVPLSDRMVRAVSQATDILKLPTNADFALHAMGLVLRSMGLAPKTGRPIGYSQRRHRQFREQQQKRARRERRSAPKGHGR